MFDKFKSEILRRAKEAHACSSEFRRAYQSENYAELISVIKDNFDFAVRRGVIDHSLVETYLTHFNTNGVYCNVDARDGFLMACGDATVTACGSATVRAYNEATVRAYNEATVTAYDRATVTACGSATVTAYNGATVTACGSATVTAYDRATVTACGSATVTACDRATVTACGSATVISYCDRKFEISGNAIYRILESNIIRYSSDNLKVEKYETTKD